MSEKKDFFGELELPKLQNEIEFGDRGSSGEIPRFRAVYGRKQICSILGRPTFESKVVYVPGIGQVYDDSGEIGQLVQDIPKQYFVVPLLVYSGENKDSYGAPVHMEYLRLTEAKYDFLVELKDINGDLSQRDTIIYVADSQKQKYQNLDFAVLPDLAKWRSDPELTETVVDLLKNYAKRIEDSFAIRVTPEQVRAKLESFGSEDAGNPPTYTQRGVGGQPAQKSLPSAPASAGDLTEKDVTDLL